MGVVNKQSFSNRCQRPVGEIEKSVCTHIVLWSAPFPLQYPPECFGNVQMRRIRRQIEKEKTSFLPDRSQLAYFMIAMNCGIIKYDKCVLTYTERECIEKADNLVCVDTLDNCKILIMVLAVNHSENIEPCGSLGRDAYLLCGQLPTVWNVSLGADVAFIGILEGNTPLTFLLFKVLAASRTCTRRTAARGLPLGVFFIRLYLAPMRIKNA